MLAEAIIRSLSFPPLLGLGEEGASDRRRWTWLQFRRASSAKFIAAVFHSTGKFDRIFGFYDETRTPEMDDNENFFIPL